MSIYWDPNDSLKRVVSCCKNFLSEVIAVAQCCCWSRYFFLKDFRTAFKLASIDNLKELRSSSKLMYTQTNIFWILLNEPEIRLYLPFFDWFGTKRTSVWFQNQSENVKYNLTWVWFNKIWKILLCSLVPSSLRTEGTASLLYLPLHYPRF